MSMAPEPVATEAKIIAAIIVLLLVFFAGWAVESWRVSGQIEKANAAAQKRIADAARENTAVLVHYRQAGDELVKRNSGLEETIRAFAEEKNREIEKLTTGRPCLGGAAVRMLNTGIGTANDRPVPKTAGIALPAFAAAATDPDAEGYASDTDVGLWIAQCQRSYDTCRGRIQALNDYYELQP